MKTKILFLFIVLLISFACKNNDVYLNYKTISSQGWSKDSSYCFNIPILDTKVNYNIFVNVRNVGEYPYQNLWLFLSKTSPNNIQISDSIECYLADQRGKWLGSGVGSMYEMSILYQENVHFDAAGTYSYKIVHGMRDVVLIGINDIGMRVEKINSNSFEIKANGKK